MNTSILPRHDSLIKPSYPLGSYSTPDMGDPLTCCDVSILMHTSVKTSSRLFVVYLYFGVCPVSLPWKLSEMKKIFLDLKVIYLTFATFATFATSVVLTSFRSNLNPCRHSSCVVSFTQCLTWYFFLFDTFRFYHKEVGAIYRSTYQAWSKLNNAGRLNV